MSSRSSAFHLLSLETATSARSRIRISKFDRNRSWGCQSAWAGSMGVFRLTMSMYILCRR